MLSFLVVYHLLVAGWTPRPDWDATARGRLSLYCCCRPFHSFVVVVLFKSSVPVPCFLPPHSCFHSIRFGNCRQPPLVSVINEEEPVIELKPYSAPRISSPYSFEIRLPQGLAPAVGSGPISPQPRLKLPRKISCQSTRPAARKLA